MAEALQPPIRLTAPPPVFAPCERVSPTAAAAVVGTGTAEELTPENGVCTGYHPDFPSCYTVCTVSAGPPRSPAPYMSSAFAPLSYVSANSHTPQLFRGPYA